MEATQCAKIHDISTQTKLITNLICLADQNLFVIITPGKDNLSIITHQPRLLPTHK